MIRGKVGCPLCYGLGEVRYIYCGQEHTIECSCAIEKPHIKVGRVYPWVCEGAGRWASGWSPREAYRRWAVA